MKFMKRLIGLWRTEDWVNGLYSLCIHSLMVVSVKETHALLQGGEPERGAPKTLLQSAFDSTPFSTLFSS